MKKRASLYDPPIDGGHDPKELREKLFESEDKELFLHVGFYITWYACVEYLLTLILQKAGEFKDSQAFNSLTRGMDARVKIERLREIGKQRGLEIGPDFDARLNHFYNCHVRLRNLLVHNYLYWPEDGHLQICTVGSPPLFKDVKFDAPSPEQIDGLTLFERGQWLKLFTYDLGELHLAMPLTGKLEIASCHSSLPRVSR